MKAVLYDRKTRRLRDGLQEVPAPVPKAGDVLIKVAAVSLNAGDYRSMSMGMIPKSGIFGADVAGRVEAVGDEVQGLKVGDEVVVDTSGSGFGGLAEYAAAPARLACLKPGNVDFVSAAALPMAAVTALQALRAAGGARPGMKVLVYGAGGGVGQFAVRLAALAGAEVTAFCGQASAGLAASLGAATVYDYRATRLEAIKERFELILGVHGKHPLRTYVGLLSDRGAYVAVGGSVSQIFGAMILGPLLSAGDRKVRAVAAQPSQDDLAYVLKLASEGSLVPYIEKTYPLAEASEAMRYAASGRAKGKLVVVP